ncbi:alpha/beta hydrolase [Enterococcus sp. AZ109]|uniref:alpha/beta hydrolase n=1 Tax=Enterococcus sp. AZ109 TaxID=2774634 RepID=UPI003F24A496
MKKLKKFGIVLLGLIIVAAAGIGIWYFNGTRTPEGAAVADNDTIDIGTEDVSIPNETGLAMAATVFTPADFDETQQYPAVVVTGPMLSVKEQAQSIYAQRLAERGIISVVFDFSHFGESEGEPRQLEDPYLHNKDISSVVNYLETLDYVDAQRIGGMGMCGSGSYMPMAAIEDPRIKAVVSVVPAITNMMDSAQIPIEEVEENQQAVEAGEGEPTYLDLMPRAFAEGAAYYYNNERGAVDNWDNRAISWSELTWEGYSPAESIDELAVPYLVITGENAWSRSAAETLYNNATSEKQMYVVDEARHFDMYDLEPYVTEAMEQILPFFDQEL